MSDEIDPEIAALIGGHIETYAGPSRAKPNKDSDPSFESLFGDINVSADSDIKGEFDIDLSKKAYEPVQCFEAANPNKFFEDPQYYQKALSGEGETSQRFHDVLKKYLGAADPKDKGMYRQQTITAYWHMISKMIPRIVANNALLPKQLMVRYGMALPTMLAAEQRDLFAKIIHEKTCKEPVFYLDEWLRAIALGQINLSSTDEVSSMRNDERARINTLLQKAGGKKDTAEAVVKAKADERKSYEAMMRERMDVIFQHSSLPGFFQIPAPYTDPQKKAIMECAELARRLLTIDKELFTSVNAYEEATKDVQTVREKAGSLGEDTKANLQALSQEFDTARQMLKMCNGRQGNHFPLLTKEYFHLNLREIGTRENVLAALAWLESIDSQAYCRHYKGALNRIEPYVVLLPSYGEQGICWEPFDRYNRHTSRARIALPLYPKNLRLAIAVAVADMRWQAAKEKASYYWMEEGLTGNYYQWFVKQKVKGDVKEYFIQDYVTWIMKESDGIQKLDKEVRGIFWRNMPFSQAVKEKLRDRSFVYQELYQRDINRSLSDGY